MKLSVSLPEKQVAYLDQVAAERGESRSRALQRALEYYYASSLGEQYERAWRDWYESGEAEVWDGTVGDGIADETR